MPAKHPLPPPADSGKPKPQPRNTRLQIPPAVHAMGNMRRVKVPEFLGVCESTFDRLRQQPDFPASFKLGPRMVVYRIADLVAWRDAQPQQQAGVGKKQ